MNKLWFNVARWIVLIFLLLVLLVLSAKGSLAYQDNITINASQLPYNATLVLEHVVPENETQNITVLYLPPNFAISHAPNVTNTTNISFSLQVLNHTVLANESSNATISVGTSLNYTILVNVTYVEPPAPVVEMSTDNGHYYINVSELLLPLEKDLSYTFNGPAGGVLNISCPAGWLTCPASDTYNSAGVAKFKIRLYVPGNASLGTVVYPITFVTGNKTVILNVSIAVTQSDDIFDTYVFKPECFVDVNATERVVKEKCLVEQEESNIQRLVRYLERIKALKNDYCPTQEKPEPEYIVAGKIDKDIYDELLICRSERASLQTDFTSSQNTLSTLQISYSDLQNVMIQNETTCFAGRTQFENSIKTQYNELVARHWKKFYWSIGITIFLILLTALSVRIYAHSKENSWSTL